jgi:hypothetical protein
MFFLCVKDQKDNANIKDFCEFTRDCRPLIKKRANSKKDKSESPELELGEERRIYSDMFVFDSKEKISRNFLAFDSSTNQVFEENTYYHGASNLESIDAFTIIDDSVYFFQFTLGSKHEVSGFGLYDIIKSITATRRSNLKYHLIFVGIDKSESFEFFSSQKISHSNRIQAKYATKYEKDANVVLDTATNEYFLLTLKPEALPEISQHILGLNVNKTIYKWGLNIDSVSKRP